MKIRTSNISQNYVYTPSKMKEKYEKYIEKWKRKINFL